MTRRDVSTAALRLAACQLLLALLLVPTARAQQQATQADPALPAWEQLSPAQREQLIGPLRERWNSQPQVRPRLLRNAQRWQQLSPEQRERAQRGLKRLEEMTPEQRKRARSQFEQMSPEQRKAWKESRRRTRPQR